jgi:hypothetical protein
MTNAPEGQPKVRVSGQPVKVSGLKLDQEMILGAQSGAAGGADLAGWLWR